MTEPKMLESAKPTVPAKNGSALAGGEFPREVYQRALELMMETGSAAATERILQTEYQPAPRYFTLRMWAREVDAVKDALNEDRKRDVINIYADASIKLGERLIDAADSLNHTQIAVPAGIATQRYTELVRPASSNPLVAFQVNLRTGDDRVVREPVTDAQAEGREEDE